MVIDLLPTAVAIYEILDKLHAHIKGWKSRKTEKKVQIQEARFIINDLSKLVNNFCETTDIVIQKWAEIYPKEDWYGANLRDAKLRVELLQANRRLFQIASDMRILEHSISKRLKGFEISSVNLISNYCLQLVELEDFISVAVGEQPLFNKPVDPFTFQFNKKYWDARQKGRLSYLHQETVPYFNRLLLKLTECKEKIAMVLLDLE